MNENNFKVLDEGRMVVFSYQGHIIKFIKQQNNMYSCEETFSGLKYPKYKKTIKQMDYDEVNQCFNQYIKEPFTIRYMDA